MKKDIFIDGETGTTGLQVHEKLSKHPNVNIMSVDQSKRKDISYKKEMLAKSDVTFLCLPDEISIETVQIADELGDKSPIIIDSSTAHRTNPNWSYGLPELGENYKKSLENSIPIGRIASVTEQALPILFLCSDASSYITGTALDVNGGQL